MNRVLSGPLNDQGVEHLLECSTLVKFLLFDRSLLLAVVKVQRSSVIESIILYEGALFEFSLLDAVVRAI